MSMKFVELFVINSKRIKSPLQNDFGLFNIATAKQNVIFRKERLDYLLAS